MKLKHITVNFHTFKSMWTKEYEETLSRWYRRFNNRIDELIETTGWTLKNDPEHEQFCDIVKQVHREFDPDRPRPRKSACKWCLYMKYADGNLHRISKAFSYDELMEKMHQRDRYLDDEIRNGFADYSYHEVYHAYPRKK